MTEETSTMSSQVDEYYRQLFEQCPVGMVMCRIDGTLIDINPAYGAIVGRTVPETLNLNYWEMMPQKYAAESAILESLEQTGRYAPCEKEYIHKDGHLVPVRLSLVLVEKDGDRLILSTVEDISDLKGAHQERQESEKILKQSEARYRSLVTTNTQIIWVTTPEGICFELESWIAYTGQSLTEAENGGWIDAVHPDDRAYTGEVWSAAVANRSLYQIEYRIRGKDGNYRYFWVWGAPVIEEDGSVQEWIGTCTDIHDRKLAEAENQYLEKRYRSLVTATSQMVWITNPEGLQKADMSNWRAYTGQSVAEADGWGWIDAVHPDDRLRTAEVWSAAVANRSLYEVEYRVRAKDGTYRYFWVCGVPVLEEDGSIREWVGTCTDIHDRKLAEQTLRQSEQRFRSLITTISQIFWVATPEGAGIVNEMLSWITYTGQTEAEFQGSGWLNAIHPDDRTRIAESWIEAVAKRSLYQTEYRLRGKDGTYRHFSVSGTPILELDGSIREWIGICTDIHDRKLAEAENQRLMDMLNHSSDAIIVRDMTDKILYWNQGAQRLYGWTREEAKDQYIYTLLKKTFPQPKEEIIAELLQQGNWEGEVQHLSRNGKLITVQSRWTLQRSISGQPCAVLEINTDITPLLSLSTKYN
jgi:PAS domain S-box-containing protein